MNKYENGKIYKIEAINGEEGDIYIGSTSQKYLCNRMGKHRKVYKDYKANKPVAKTTPFILFDKYGVENCIITLLELVNCQCKEELLAKERFYLQTLQCVNKNVPLRTNKEYYQDNKEKITAYKTKWEIDNKSKRDEYRHNRYDSIKTKYSKPFKCECGATGWEMNKNRHFKTKKHQDFILNQSK
jgi:hypothetical protein